MTYSREALDLARYQIAVADNPRHPKEGCISYIRRIAELAAGLELAAPKSMPEARLPYREVE